MGDEAMGRFCSFKQWSWKAFLVKDLKELRESHLFHWGTQSSYQEGKALRLGYVWKTQLVRSE